MYYRKFTSSIKGFYLGICLNIEGQIILIFFLLKLVSKNTGFENKNTHFIKIMQLKKKIQKEIKPWHSTFSLTSLLIKGEQYR